MRVRYFAWVRERIGVAEEEISPPDEVKTAGDLIGWLRARGDGYEAALERESAIRIAVDRKHVPHEAPLGKPQEVALFPPMTGG